MSDAAAIWVGTATTLLGAVIGSGVTLATEAIRARGARRERRDEALLTACAEFAAGVARLRSTSYGLRERPADHARAEAYLEDARVGCERLRLLLEAKDGQLAARLALRHLYAVWQVGLGQEDPRASQYPGRSPEVRLRSALNDLYVAVRLQIGSRAPGELMESLVD
jgi:hypothetical protein